MIYPVVLAFALLRGAWHGLWMRGPVDVGAQLREMLPPLAGDGATDDTEGLQRRFNLGATYGYGVHLRGGTYLVGRPLMVGPRTVITNCEFRSGKSA